MQPTDSPGPGGYNISPIKEGPSFHLSPKLPRKQLSFSPGPGNYDPKPLHSSPSFSTGKAN